MTLASVAFTVAQQAEHCGPSAIRVGQKQESSEQIEMAELIKLHCAEHAAGVTAVAFVVDVWVAIVSQLQRLSRYRGAYDSRSK